MTKLTLLRGLCFAGPRDILLADDLGGGTVFETNARRERQLKGIAMAKREGAYGGFKARLDR